MIFARLKTFCLQSWFLLALAVILIVGQSLADSLSWLTELPELRTAVVVSVIFVMALGVPLADIVKQVAKPIPTLLAASINMVFLPLAAYGVGQTLPTNLAGGFIVAASIPCTLASAAVWTRRAGGDDSIAMLVMLITNLSCFIITPLWLFWLLGQAIEIDARKLIFELFLLVLVPSVIAQLLRYRVTQVASFAQRFKKELSTFAQFGILFMVLLGAIHLQISNKASTTSAYISYWPVLQTTLGAVSLHGLALAVGWYTSQLIGLQRKETIGVAISGSQKTLMVGLQICIDCGVSILPMVLYHISQLLIDTVLADWWARNTPAKTSESV